MDASGATESPVTVGIAAYQCAEYIEAAVRSAFSQTAPPYEVAVVEDGSADATPAILERLQKEFSNLRVVRQSHSGASVALNRALGFCRTPLIVALGADDLLDPRACQLLREEAERRPEAALIYADYTVIGPNGALVREVRNPEPHDPVGQLLAMHDRLGGDTRHDFLPFGPPLLFRTESLRLVGGLDVDVWYANDVDICLRLGEKWPFAHVPEFLYRYRWHGGNLGLTSRTRQVACFREVVRRHYWRREKAIPYGPPNLGEMEMLIAPGA